MTQANTAIVKLSPSGDIQIRSSAQTNVVVDVSGYYTDSSTGRGFLPVDPERLVDSRVGLGVPAGRRSSASADAIQVSGFANVPAGATSAVVNYTLVGPSVASAFKTYVGSQVPASAPNFVYPQLTTSVAATVSLDSSGSFNIRLNAGNSHLLIDVVGYFSASTLAGGFTATSGRILDTRVAPSVAIPANSQIDVVIADRAGIPQLAIGAAVINITVISGNAAGFVRAWPKGKAQPETLAVSYSALSTVANQSTVAMGTDGASVSILNHGNQPIHVVLDAQGYYSSEPVSYVVSVEFPDGSVVSRNATTNNVDFEPATDGSLGLAQQSYDGGALDFTEGGIAPPTPLGSNGLPRGAETGDGPEVWPNENPSTDSTDDDPEPTEFSPDVDGVRPRLGTLDAAREDTPRKFYLFGNNVTRPFIYKSDAYPQYLNRCVRAGCQRIHTVKVRFRQNLRQGANSVWDITGYSRATGGTDSAFYESRFDYYCGVNIKGAVDKICDESEAVGKRYNLFIYEGYTGGDNTYSWNFGGGNRTYIGKFPMLQIDTTWQEYQGVGVRTRFRGWDTSFRCGYWCLNAATGDGR